jgi:chemotaxis family two-component system response regulator Rcp1
LSTSFSWKTTARTGKLTLEAIRDCSVETNVNVVHDGAQAMAFLRHEGVPSQAPRPALILLDLDLPGKAGHELLASLKDDPVLRRIPVIVFSTAESDLATHTASTPTATSASPRTASS